MNRGIFITGTDTGVGKTVGSAAFMHALRKLAPACYWKPVQTGMEQDDDTARVRGLGGCSQEEIIAEGVRLPRPLSPHLSARLAGQTITLDGLIDLYCRIPDSVFKVVEGAGGALVPLADSLLMTDLMVALDLPIVVIARSGLGTINHTLLTIEALRARRLSVGGVLMIGEPNLENRTAIAQYGNTAVLGEMPPLDPLTSSTVRDWAQSSLNLQPLLEIRP
ncbi:MAG TPA: dethiobiotin synthase [Blastocatellia bacterium]|nr:dethiobiotin synthase [Blastocatellia bacterium]